MARETAPEPGERSTGEDDGVGAILLDAPGAERELRRLVVLLDRSDVAQKKWCGYSANGARHE